ncbi:MAG: glycosyl hydrolase 53 family protein, partial [Fibrobacteria bacterium]
MGWNRKSCIKAALAACMALSLAVSEASAAPRTEPFYLGVDISGRSTQSEAGRMNLLNTLKAHGVNSVRLRTFVDPTAEDGYSKAGACGLDATIAFAKQVKAAGMHFLLDFHYSDNWADPGKQCVPMAWQKYTTITEMAAALHDYTKDAITKLVAAGARPDMVAIGNETTPGMCIHKCGAGGKPAGTNPVNGSTSNWANLGALLKAGVDATHEVDPTIVTSFHIAQGGDHTSGAGALSNSVNWLTNALKYSTVDAFGESSYFSYQGDKSSEANSKASWTKVETGLVEKFPKVKIYAAEIGGFERAINDVNFNLPNQMGIGTYFWEATMNATWNQGPLLTGSGGNYTWVPAKATMYDKMVEDYGLKLIPAGIAPKENILKADSRGRLRMLSAGNAVLFGIPDP